MSKRVLEALNDELHTLNIMVGMSIVETRGTEDGKVIQTLKCSLIDAQSAFVKGIERLYYGREK